MTGLRTQPRGRGAHPIRRAQPLHSVRAVARAYLPGQAQALLPAVRCLLPP